MIRLRGSVYNEINLGFAILEVYTSEKGVENAIMRNQLYDFEVPKEEIYSEKIEE